MPFLFMSFYSLNMKGPNVKSVDPGPFNQGILNPLRLFSLTIKNNGSLIFTDRVPYYKYILVLINIFIIHPNVDFKKFFVWNVYTGNSNI